MVYRFYSTYFYLFLVIWGMVYYGFNHITPIFFGSVLF